MLLTERWGLSDADVLRRLVWEAGGVLWRRAQTPTVTPDVPAVTPDVPAVTPDVPAVAPDVYMRDEAAIADAIATPVSDVERACIRLNCTADEFAAIRSHFSALKGPFTLGDLENLLADDGTKQPRDALRRLRAKKPKPSER